MDGAIVCMSRTNFFIVFHFDLWIESEQYECGSSTLIPMTANVCACVCVFVCLVKGKKIGINEKHLTP